MSVDELEPGSILVAEVGKNSREAIRVVLSKYRGYNLVNLRVWYIGDGGKWLPSKSGITVRTSRLEDLRDALTKAIDVAKSNGLA